jgi:hypothetical protein
MTPPAAAVLGFDDEELAADVLAELEQVALRG